MNFKTWRDFYLFVREYAKYSCCNCKHSSAGTVDVDDPSNKDTAYARHFCSHFVAMVRWDLSPVVCKHWESKDGDKLPKDDNLLTLSEDVLKILEEDEDKKWTFKEVVEVANEHG